MSMRWFAFTPNESFTDEFREFMSALLDLTAKDDLHAFDKTTTFSYKVANQTPEYLSMSSGEVGFDYQKSEYLVDILPLLQGYKSAIAEMINAKPWLHLTLLAACMMDRRQQVHNPNIRSVLADPGRYEYLQEILSEWTSDAGLLTIWESLQVNDPDLKSMLYQKLYRSLGLPFEIDIAECAKRDPWCIYEPQSVGRAVRLMASGVSKADLRDEVPFYFHEYCSLDFILNPSAQTRSKSCEFVDKIVTDYSVRGDNRHPYQLMLLARNWLYEMVRCALVQGQEPARVLEGAALMAAGFSDYLKMERREAATFERQLLVNAATPFPAAVALLNPEKADFFVTDPENTIGGPFVDHIYYGKKDFGFTFVARTLAALGIEFSPEDLFHLHNPQPALEGYVVSKGGRCPQVEAWMADNAASLDMKGLSYLYDCFDRAALSDETLLKMQLYQVDYWHSQPKQKFVTAGLKLEMRQANKEPLIKAILEKGQLTERIIKKLELSAEDIRPFFKQMSVQGRRLLMELDLGL